MSHFGTRARRQRRDTDRKTNGTGPCEAAPMIDLEAFLTLRPRAGSGLPLLSLEHSTGTMDNWDLAVADPLAGGRELILFDGAGMGRSSGKVPDTISDRNVVKHCSFWEEGVTINVYATVGSCCPLPIRSNGCRRTK